jgi:UDP-N-acetylglucosamine--N-acetylmuramyl-(pentapeptide) pyrophosphoryl-undecaprenol N-acetylglucosamine transferase
MSEHQNDPIPDPLGRSDPALAGEGNRVLVAAGGTGGHLFPAEALAAALGKRNVAVELVTDSRAARHAGAFAGAVHVIPSATIRGKNPISLAHTGGMLGYGLLKAWRMLPRLKPAVVVGFGGYPTIPPILAATLRGIPTVIHEQNAVMGRANRLLAPRVRAIATGFADVLKARPALAAKATHTGNPVRPAVITASATAYPALDTTGPLQLLVFGGSQGASVMADIVPAAVGRLEPHLQMRLRIVQQARDEDCSRVRDTYQNMQVHAEIAPFFADLPARMAASHLVVSRSGASTVAELAAIGRPAILVPLPHALDQDQRANAGVLMQAGGAIRLDQSEFTPDRLAAEIAALASEPARLSAMATAAKSMGSIEAAERLADLVLRVAGVILGPGVPDAVRHEVLHR